VAYPGFLSAENIRRPKSSLYLVPLLVDVPSFLFVLLGWGLVPFSFGPQALTLVCTWFYTRTRLPLALFFSEHPPLQIRHLFWDCAFFFEATHPLSFFFLLEPSG